MKEHELPPRRENPMKLPQLNDVIQIRNETGVVTAQIGNKLRVYFKETEKIEELTFLKTHVRIGPRIFYVVQDAEFARDDTHGIIGKYRLVEK
ncbi:MAG: hypothetical protein AAB483_02165 [Patescibacteria group bacterium]